MPEDADEVSKVQWRCANQARRSASEERLRLAMGMLAEVILHRSMGRC